MDIDVQSDRWHRMSARERREALGLGDRADLPAPELSADGGYLVPDRFVEHLKSLLH